MHADWFAYSCILNSSINCHNWIHYWGLLELSLIASVASWGEGEKYRHNNQGTSILSSRAFFFTPKFSKLLLWQHTHTRAHSTHSGRDFSAWRTVNFPVCGKHSLCLWKEGRGIERRALFREHYSWAKKVCLLANLFSGWSKSLLDLILQSFPEAEAAQDAGTWEGALLGPQSS